MTLSKFVGLEYNKPRLGDRVRILVGEYKDREVTVESFRGNAFANVHPLGFTLDGLSCWIWPWQVEVIFSA